jgi:hypothetical protein
MPVRRQDKTTLLPQALLERIKEQGMPVFMPPVASQNVYSISGKKQIPRVVLLSQHVESNNNLVVKKGTQRRMQRSSGK